MYKLCVFDLDGTLANTLNSIAHFGNTALENLGLETIDNQEYKLMVGNGADVLMQRMLMHNGMEATEELCRKLRTEYDRLYEADPLKLVVAYPGIVQLLDGLKDMGIKLAVLSNKPDNMTVYIADNLFPKVFDHVQGGQEGVPKKPSPAALLKIIEEMGCTQEDTIYCGDSGVDMESGKNAGVFSVGVLWGFRDEQELCESGADVVIKTPAELLHIV